MESETKLNGNTDPMAWAMEFERTSLKNDWAPEDIDAGLMLAWFANAMCAQKDADAVEIEKLTARIKQLKADHQAAVKLAENGHKVITIINRVIQDHSIEMLKAAGIEVPEMLKKEIGDGDGTE